MKTVLVIGIGMFGKHLAKRMAELGNEVMVIDKNEERVNEMLPFVTRAQIGDCMDPKVLQALGVNNFDICFVCIGDSFQASLEITSQLKDLGAKHVVSKADREIQEKFLLRNGADEAIHPERDVALRAARKYSAQNVFEYFELSGDFSLFEIAVPPGWIGRNVKEINVRLRFNINIIAAGPKEKMLPFTDAEHVFSSGEHLIIAGKPKDCEKLLNLSK